MHHSRDWSRCSSAALVSGSVQRRWRLLGAARCSEALLPCLESMVLPRPAAVMCLQGEERAEQSLVLRASAAWRLRLRARPGPLAGAHRVYLRNRVCVGIFLNWMRREEDEATRGVLLYQAGHSGSNIDAT
ncbi:hypothetical protein VPH35_104568 [Triticum aestivum]